MKKVKKLAALLLVLSLSLSLAVPTFAANYENSIDGGYGVSVYLDVPNTAYYSSYTTNGVNQGHYSGTNFTMDQTSHVLFTVNCKAGSTTWRGARNTLVGYASGQQFQEINGYTVSKGLSNTVYQIVLDHTNGPLNFARAQVRRPSTKSIQAATSVWTLVTMEESVFAAENGYK